MKRSYLHFTRVILCASFSKYLSVYGTLINVFSCFPAVLNSTYLRENIKLHYQYPVRKRLKWHEELVYYYVILALAYSTLCIHALVLIHVHASSQQAVLIKIIVNKCVFLVLFLGFQKMSSPAANCLVFVVLRKVSHIIKNIFKLKMQS